MYWEREIWHLTFGKRLCTISLTDISEHVILKEKILSGVTMKQKECQPEEMLPLTPAVFHILLALADRERHGYGIMQEVAARTEGAMRMGPGTLYGSIKRMLADGLIEASDARPH